MLIQLIDERKLIIRAYGNPIPPGASDPLPNKQLGHSRYIPGREDATILELAKRAKRCYRCQLSHVSIEKPDGTEQIKTMNLPII